MTANSDAQIIANLVILDRAAEKHKAALLLEGKTDGRLYKKVLDPSRCRTFAAGNRAIAALALDILQEHGTKGVLALVDADTDYLTGKRPSNKNLLITHTRDVEGIVFQSDALRDVLIEFDLEDAFGPTPEIAAINAAVPIAIVKVIADREKSKVRTSELEFHKFINPLDLACDGTELCKQMEALTEANGVSADVYERELKKMLASVSDPFHVLPQLEMEKAFVR